MFGRKNMLKKILALLCAYTMMFSIVAFAQLQPAVTVGTAEGQKGDTVDIPVALSNCAGFCDLNIEIGYNAEAFELKSVTKASVPATCTLPQYITKNPYNISWNDAGNVYYNGTLVTLTFEILTETAGDYPVTVDFYKGVDGDYADGDDVNHDENFEPLDLQYVNGKITVEAPPAVPSFSSYYDSGYYAEEAESMPEEGIIAFTAQITNISEIDLSKVEKVGLYIFKAGSDTEKVELNVTDPSVIAEKDGYMFSFVKSITNVSDFGRTVVAKPYVIFNDGTDPVYGDLVIATVKDNWLGDVSLRP